MRIALLLWFSSLLYAQTLSPQAPHTGMATISGVVLEASGKPYVGARVWTMKVPPHQFRTREGLQEVVAAHSPATDAQGRFQLSVAPGSYLVCAFPPGVGLDDTKMALPRVSPPRRNTPLLPPLL